MANYEEDEAKDARTTERERGKGESRKVGETVQATSRTAGDSLIALTRDARNSVQGVAGAIDLLHHTPLTPEQREYVGYVSGASKALIDSVVRYETELTHLADIASSRQESNSVERILAVAREALGMEVAFASEFLGGEQVYRTVEGDGASFGLREGAGIPLEATFCQRLIAGKLPNVVPDAKNDERVSYLDITSSAGIGAYVGVPLQLSDGRLYGTLCCLSHSREPHLQERDMKFMDVLARLVAEQIEREEIEANNRRLEVRAAGLSALLTVLAVRDGYTADHSKTVVEHSTAVARRMGLSEEEVAEVEQAAALHDIGKIGVPDAILNKPGALTDTEREVVRTHTAIGEDIVSSTKELAHLAPIIRAAHERWDGEGYPDGLSGEAIPIASRIILVCDAFEAMTSDRPYRRALGVQTALEELRKNAGTQFCPRTVKTFLDGVVRRVK